MRYLTNTIVVMSLAAAGAAAVACGGSSNSSNVIAPSATATVTTETFNGTVQPGGTINVHSFLVTTPGTVTVTLTAAGTSRTDTLRFDATGHAELSLPPGVYSYGSPSGAERGVVAVETYSDEWRPAAPVLRAQAGGAAGRLASAPLRERWWLFVVAIAAFATEWAWRRRQGLP